MKRLFISCLLLGTVFQLRAQYADSTTHTMTTDYLKKSRNQRTAGWILLGGGAILTVVSGITASNEISDGWNFDPGTGAEILAGAGLLSMIGSIPLFIAAGRNRRKAAAAVSFKIENSTQIRQWAFRYNRYPAISLQIKL